LLGAEDQLKAYYYKKYATPDRRPLDHEPLPEGLTLQDYFRYANVDVPSHCFHPELAVPWLMSVFKIELDSKTR